MSGSSVFPLPPPLPSSSHGGDRFNLQQIRDRFKAIDRNGDGILSKEELLTLLTHSGMDAASAAKHAATFFSLAAPTAQGVALATSDATVVGTSSSSSSTAATPSVTGVSYGDFVNEYVRMSRFKALKAVQDRFQQLDTNADGLISKDELHSALTAQLGSSAAAAQIDRVYEEMIGGAAEAQGVDLKAFWTWYRSKSNQIRLQQEEEAKATQMK